MNSYVVYLDSLMHLPISTIGREKYITEFLEYVSTISYVGLQYGKRHGKESS